MIKDDKGEKKLINVMQNKLDSFNALNIKFKQFYKNEYKKKIRDKKEKERSERVFK